MQAPAIYPAGHAGVAASAAPPMRRPWGTLLGALLLTLTPMASAAATEPEEWPTSSDRGPRSPTRIPWLRFSGDPAAPVLVAVPGQALHAHEVVVLREQELSRRQRRLLRRAERHAEKAARLRARAGTPASRDTYVMVVPAVQAAPPAHPVTVMHPQVHAVRLDSEHESDDCDESDHGSEHARERAERARERAERARERAERDAERTMQRERHHSGR